jgi:hypothetical protein
MRERTATFVTVLDVGMFRRMREDGRTEILVNYKSEM